jgi:hypothetical protein
MRLDPDGLREALSSALEMEAREALARHRGDPAALDPAAVLARHDWIESPEILEARATFHGQGVFTREEAAAFEWHVRRLRREAVLARSRRSLETLRARRFRGEILGDAIEVLAIRADEGARAAVDEAVSLAAPVLHERRHEADERAGAEMRDADAPEDGLAEQAARSLSADDDAFAESRERLGLAERPRAPGEWARALRSPECDAVFPCRARLRRAGSFLPGFERELSARVRPVNSLTLLGPRPRVLVVQPPAEVRLLLPALELGLASEILTFAEVGRALALALVSPALPPALRHPTAGSVARAFGWLVARAVVEPAYARREERLRGRLGETIRARGGAFFAFVRRLAALAVIAESSRLSAGECQELVASRLGLRLGREEVVLAMLTPSGAAARFRGLHAAERLHCAFVERYDEDYLWNPRFEEPIRAAAERGALLSVEGFMRELGA